MKGFMPYNLFLDDEGDDFDSLFNNLTNFYFWCDSRMLTLDIIDVALRGRQISVGNSHLIADDISTNGLFPKAWIRRDNGFYLLKDGGADVVDMELLASKICR